MQIHLPKLKLAAKSVLTTTSFATAESALFANFKVLDHTGRSTSNAFSSSSTRFEMNSKHLQKGDACPPLQDGKLRIYNMRFCPYAQRALLIAAAKKIPYEVVNINLMTKPDFIFEKNPGGKVPTLELPGGQGCLYESLIVCDYMDEVYPISGEGGGDASKPLRLQSIDPLRKAQDRILIERFSEAASQDHKIAMLSPESKDGEIKELLGKLFDSLKIFEEELVRRGTKFFGGEERPGMLDYMIWPWFERLPSHGLMWGSNFEWNKAMDKLPTLKKWESNMVSDPAVQESYLSPEAHLSYRMARKRGPPDYDLIMHINKLS